MSIISSYEIDNSAALAKRFASLTRSYFENPSAAKDRSAQVPLENIFRMLEMFRYGSFEDETRRGVLVLQGLEDEPRRTLNDSSWHSRIEAALKDAMTEVYGDFQKDEVINQLEDSLRWLVTNQDISKEALKRAQDFFAKFETLV